VGKPAARLGDSTSHGSALLGACATTVLIGGKPAWRIGDQHTCPIPNAPPPLCDGAPHGPGATTPGGNVGDGSTLIQGKPAAALGDIVMEAHALVPLPPANPIISGATDVLVSMTGGGLGGGATDLNECTTEGHPVDVATGRVFASARDFRRLKPVPLIFQRFHSSALPAGGAFGAKWRHIYEIVLHETENSLELENEYGERIALPRPEPLTTAKSAGIRVEAASDGTVLVWRSPEDGLSFTPRSGGGYLLTAIHDGQGLVRFLTYDLLGRLSMIEDHCGRALLIAYSGERIAALSERSCEDRRAVRTIAEYSYDHRGQLIGVTNATGGVTQYRYDRGYLVQETDGCGFSFYFEYDAIGRCTRTWGDGGVLYRKLDYDFDNGVTRVTNSRGVSWLYFHAEGRVTRLLHADGSSSERSYDTASHVLAVSDEIGAQIQLVRDDEGRIAKMLFPSGLSVAFQYDEIGRVISVTRSDGVMSRWQYDANGLLRSSASSAHGESVYQYDPWNNLIRATNADGSWFTVVYDRFHRPIEISRNTGYALRLAYSVFSDLARIEDAASSIAEASFDAAGRVLHLKRPGGLESRYQWNPEGRLQKVLSSNGIERSYKHRWRDVVEERVFGQSVDFQYIYTYDLEGDVTEVRLPGGGKAEFIYNDRGHLIEQRYPDGRICRLTVDAAGRTLELREGDVALGFEHDDEGNIVRKFDLRTGDSVEYEFDPFGRIVKASTASSSVSLKYDALGRKVEETSGDISLRFTYDARGNRVRMSPSLGTEVAFDFSSDGGLESIRAGGQTAAEFQYDDRGNVSERRYGNGVTDRRLLDGLERVKSIQLTGPGGEPLQRSDFVYDSGSRITRIVRARGASIDFAYSGPDWVSLQKLSDESAPRQIRYDSDGNALRLASGAEARFDAGGRLLSDDRYAYEYDKSGRTSARTDRQGARTSFRYDFLGQLTEVLHSNGSVTKYAYDALGRRVSKLSNDVATTYVWDDDRLVAASVPAGNTGEDPEITQYIADPHSLQPLAQMRISPDGAVRDIQYCHTDYLDCVCNLTSSDGSLLWDAVYDAFGACATSFGDPSQTILRRPGQFFDAETDLYYNRYRYYDPGNGRFISPDPIDYDSGSFNLYRYPDSTTSAIDLLGLGPWNFMVDNNFLVKLMNSEANGGTEWISKFAKANDRGRMGMSSQVQHEFLQKGNFSKEQRAARAKLLAKFGIEVSCPGKKYIQLRDQFQREGLSQEDAAVAAHAKSLDTPLVSGDQRIRNAPVFRQNSLQSWDIMGEAEGLQMRMLQFR